MIGGNKQRGKRKLQYVGNVIIRANDCNHILSRADEIERKSCDEVPVKLAEPNWEMIGTLLECCMHKKRDQWHLIVLVASMFLTLKSEDWTRQRIKKTEMLSETPMYFVRYFEDQNINQSIV